MRRIIGSLAVLGALIAAGTVVYTQIPPGPDEKIPPGPDEKIPSVPGEAYNVFVHVAGSDTGSNCTRFGTPVAPPADESTYCLTLNRAYQVAQPGDTVRVAAGTYPGQMIVRDASKTSTSDVVFVPAVGSTVTLSTLKLGNTKGDDSSANAAPSHITFDGVMAGGFGVTSNLDIARVRGGIRGEDITIKNMRANGGYLRSPKDLSLINVEIPYNDYGKCCSSDGLQISIGATGDPSPENVLLDGVYMHDIARRCEAVPNHPSCPGDDSAAHADCIQFFGGLGVTIRNSRFYNCGTQAVFLRSASGGSYSNITLENNMVGQVWEPGGGIILAENGACDVSGFVHLYYNSSAAGIRVDGDGVCGGTEVLQIGNIATKVFSGNCGPGPHSYNLYATTTCGTTDTLGLPSYVANTKIAPDLHLLATSLGLEIGSPSYCPATDLEGDSRPLPVATICDAGADERSR